MVVVHVVAGVSVLVLTLAAGAWGAWCWYQGLASPRFWPLLRTAQVATGVQVVLGVVLLLTGHKAHAQLHVLYGALPLLVSFIAEQLRVAAAESVLDQRGLEGSEAVRALPEGEQREIVMAIVRREVGVMAAAALVMFVLALRAAQVSGAF